MARIFLMILVFSFRLRILNEDTVCQNDLCFVIDLNMSEYKTVMTVKGMAIKITDIATK